MTRRTTADHRQATADTLQAIAALLTAPTAERTFALITATAQVGYPTKASTAPSQPHNERDEDGKVVHPPSATERPVLDPDPAAGQAQQLIARYQRLGLEALRFLHDLEGWQPGRSVAVCHRCGFPLDPKRKRCQRMIDGVQCGASENAWPACKVCSTPMAPGDRAGGMHYRCRENTRRPAAEAVTVRQNRGTDTIRTGDLARDFQLEYGGTLTSEGTYVAD